MKTKKTKSEAPNLYPIIGKSKAMEQVRKAIVRHNASTKDLLIIGEAGIGKGAIARNIIFQGPRNQEEKPFQAINLSVIDTKELDSVLFGYDRGADRLPYTSKRGIFELTDGGTVLLEELEEAPLPSQLKIHQFIQDRRARRIGGVKAVPVAVRLIVTMKSTPRTLVERKKLLPDLFSRLEGWETLTIPPLRERPEDIPLLAKYFMEEISAQLGLTDIVVDINAIDILVKQPWRENIRELKAVIDRSVLFSQEGKFTLPPELSDERTEVVKMINNVLAGQEFVLDRSLDVIERGIIERTLDRFGLNQSRAAMFLGMTEQTLRYKLRRLGIASTHERASKS